MDRMRRLAGWTLMVLLLSGSALAEEWRTRDDYIRDFYRNHPRDSRYEAWKTGRWSNDEYRDWYRTHHDEGGRAADRGVAALFGLLGVSLAGRGRADGPDAAPAAALDAPAAGGFRAGTADYNRYCSAKYRSFDPATGTYMSFAGERRHCR